VKKKRALGIAAVITIVIVAIIAAFYGYQRYAFPYGSDHRCNILLYFALRNYAEKNGGAFPTGEATPEASLSRINSLDEYAACGYLLRRRDVPVEVVDEILKQGKLLGPETCGWNYVEGLRLDSNSELALFWDKEGLTEMGMRLSGGGHIVTFIHGHMEQIPESEWDEFLEKQKKLLAEEMAKKR
jgi:hypothetical protein